MSLRPIPFHDADLVDQARTIRLATPQLDDDFDSAEAASLSAAYDQRRSEALRAAQLDGYQRGLHAGWWSGAWACGLVGLWVGVVAGALLVALGHTLGFRL